MGHCSGGADAPWNIGAAYLAKVMKNIPAGVPGYNDRYHDAILALLAWTENGTAPDYLVGTKFEDDDRSRAVVRQRPICPYPQRASYVSGDVNVASSWTCTSKN
ncbi:hypothetical protein EYZ11_005294 [Aspergillus tanneri]|uniref:Carboxylic ester hydrolase n=1 Tax=Aspergillus tanneri TaxID=1220188 RepID=A0A4S3JKN2_9EURO|nr:uncharacterized protein ATNIH1004_009135 [Aspergillus tanneri]KAA8644924.1 hypothetical protein ATNIH1004_009135 [Aspergillus tanneri]THC95217.1 hypothetical protein EYZ11_005294 [Aspergillus tanneri]